MIEIMYLIAIIGDLLSLIPFLNILTTPIIAFALWIAGLETGVEIFGKNRTAWTVAAIFIEMIPGVSFIPAWTTRVWIAKSLHSPQKNEEY